MLSTALKPKWLALLVVVLIAASGMAWLGSWQLQRAHERSAESVATKQHAPAVQLTSVLTAQQSFPGALADKPVAVSGTWDGQRQLLVAGKKRGAVTGFWVLTPLVLADGSAIGVVRGWVSSPADPAAAAPSGQVAVEGILLPGEAPVARDPGQGTGLPAGQVDVVAPAQLVQVWPHPLFTGYVAASTVTPSRQPAPKAVSTVATGGGGLAVQNLSYAIQWWVFAAFGLFLWYRLVRDDHRGLLAAPPDPSDPPDATPPTPVGDDGVASSAVPGARS